MNDKIREAFNQQINAEFYSSYLYLSMAMWADANGFEGMGNWLRLQAEEEKTHAMKFMDYCRDRDGRVLLMGIEGPKTEWASPLDVFNDVAAHEVKVTEMIHKLVDLALAESDHASNAFLQWFVDEQVEEEATARAICDKLELAGDGNAILYMIDRELGARTTASAV